jgi:hypothetical protein
MVDQDERVIAAEENLNIMIVKDEEWRKNYPDHA